MNAPNMWMKTSYIPTISNITLIFARQIVQNTSRISLKSLNVRVFRTYSVKIRSASANYVV